MRAALGELVRREVLSVSADPLSPERGSYQFAQQMLRQVAYDTLSRRDRKARHLKVAEHLRAAFSGDGEEVVDVIARHYLDALTAAPEDPDADQIREQAIGALIRAAERAERTGAPGRAAASYATAAGLTSPDTAGPQPSVGLLWERAAESALADGSHAGAVGHVAQARAHYLRDGQTRAAARAQAIAGQALSRSGRHAEAHDQLIAAMEVLRADPDTDTVNTLSELAVVAVFTGAPDADRLSAEALTLGQDLDVAASRLVHLFTTRGIYLGSAGRRPQAAAYFRESARLATQAGDNFGLGRAQLNLSHVLAVTEPAAGAEAARAAVVHLRRAGMRDYLTTAVTNLVMALFLLGEWDAAEQELAQAEEADGISGNDYLACYQAWLAALRGDASTAEAKLAALRDIRDSEDAQDHSLISVTEAFAAAARNRPGQALNHARATLACADAIGISHDDLRWAWPLAARAADELRDDDATRDLLTLLDAWQPGHIAPLQKAERDLARIRLAARDGGQDISAGFALAINGLRELSTPYHLAHGLLDYAQYLIRLQDPDAAAVAVDEARGIAQQLRCQPLLDRAAALAPAGPRILA